MKVCGVREDAAAAAAARENGDAAVVVVVGVVSAVVAAGAAMAEEEDEEDEDEDEEGAMAEELAPIMNTSLNFFNVLFTMATIFSCCWAAFPARGVVVVVVAPETSSLFPVLEGDVVVACEVISVVGVTVVVVSCI